MQQDCPYKIWCSVHPSTFLRFQSLRVWIRHLACHTPPASWLDLRWWHLASLVNGFIAVCDLRLPCSGNTDCVVTMSIKTIKYFSTIIVAVVAVLAGWWLWNYYMQSPWTRDGKIRAEQVSITPQVSGRIIELNIKDNQLVNAGIFCSRSIKRPFRSPSWTHRLSWRKRNLTSQSQ